MKRKITYHKDGRRFVGDKIENEQSASNLWSTALTRSVVRDLKDQSNEDPTSRNTGLKRYGEFFGQNKAGKKKWHMINREIQ
ncbi:unnamed protein product [Onchocerca flexuosa]|uniref:Recombinase n=1 Tax=Onchocerca flexuosa TaxID=387005 RepID=A0A183HVP7_9BILA|nr:unnamed protein product [Onchocerca flexuosa]